MRIANYHLTALFISIALVVLSLPELAGARAKYDYDITGPAPGKILADQPYVQGAVHNVGRIGLTVTNEGSFGKGFIGSFVDPFSGLAAPSCQYPYPGKSDYLFAGAFWIGAIVGRDTLVSVGADGWSYIREMWPPSLDDPSHPGLYPNGMMLHHSLSDPNDTAAVSEQDFIAMYTDTVTDPGYVTVDANDGRPHKPLGIEITQRSYAWSYSYAQDFVLFDYSIKNIGRNKLNKVYMGVYVDGDVGTAAMNSDDAQDDICGFKRDVSSFQGCGFMDTINIAWIADNDGVVYNPTGLCPAGYQLTAVTGTRVVRTPSDSLKYSFNWWISNGTAPLDFGPRKIGTTDDPFRDFGGFLGTPEGDRNKYYIMRHEEFDYDQLFANVDHTSEGWLPRPSQASDFADGFDTRYLLSFGPFEISPGEVLPLSLAYVAGADFHRPDHCEDFAKLFNSQFPEEYYNSFNFDSLGKNAVWASWIYDNPGVATSGDSNNRGKYRLCILETDTADQVIDTIRADTFWYQGDGIPDFKGASPPPAPKIWVYPSVNGFNEGELRVRFNGLRSETTRDVFSQLIDFEGYRVYMGLTNQPKDFVTITSYDREDFNKYIWDPRQGNNGDYILKDLPFPLDSLKILYGANFDPSQYPRDNPFAWKDSLFYFNAQDWNRSNLLDSTLIHKKFPNEPRPQVLVVDSARIYHPEQLTEDGYFKYFEYEVTLRHLLPSQLYYVAVTAFDFGSPGSGLLSLETPPRQNMIAEYAQNQTRVVESGKLKVIVYPNPYRIDANYASAAGGSFEGRGESNPNPERIRAIHFMNLPHKCKIRIFTIDGDLVREIDHDMPPNDPQSMHDTWDLITRNTQAVVSGIYYYSVESDQGNQLGKIVIIM